MYVTHTLATSYRNNLIRVQTVVSWLLLDTKGK